MPAAPYTETEKEVINDLAPSKYQPATRQYRDNIETQDLFAQAAFWSREYQLNPADLEAATKLAAALRKMGNPGKAVEITQTTRALYPTDPFLTAEYAAALIASERGEEALEPLSKALNTAPGYARLWSLKGAALDQVGNYALAQQHYNRALQISPNDPNVMTNMGLSYALAGDPQTAEQWLRRAASQPNAGPNVQRNLNLVMQLQGKQPRPAPSPMIARQSQPAPMSTPQMRPAAGQSAAQSHAQKNAQTPAYQPQRQMSAPSPSPVNAPSSQAAMPDAPRIRSYVTSTGQGGSGPKSASEAAMMAAQQSQGQSVRIPSAPPQTGPQPQPPAAQPNDIYSRLADNVKPRPAAPAPNAGYPAGQPVQMRTYPANPESYSQNGSGSPTPPRRAPQRRR